MRIMSCYISNNNNSSEIITLKSSRQASAEARLGLS